MRTIPMETTLWALIRCLPTLVLALCTLSIKINVLGVPGMQNLTKNLSSMIVRLFAKNTAAESSQVLYIDLTLISRFLLESSATSEWLAVTGTRNTVCRAHRSDLKCYCRSIFTSKDRNSPKSTQPDVTVAGATHSHFSRSCRRRCRRSTTWT